MGGDVVKVTAQLTPKAKSNFTLQDGTKNARENEKKKRILMYVYNVKGML